MILFQAYRYESDTGGRLDFIVYKIEYDYTTTRATIMVIIDSLKGGTFGYGDSQTITFGDKLIFKVKPIEAHEKNIQMAKLFAL